MYMLCDFVFNAWLQSSFLWDNEIENCMITPLSQEYCKTLTVALLFSVACNFSNLQIQVCSVVVLTAGPSGEEYKMNA